MSRAGDVFENPVTGERVVVRVGTEESRGDLLVADLYVRPGGAVAGEHVHTRIEEWFTVVGGRVGFHLDGLESIAPQNERLHVPVGVAHDWWNAGEDEAQVVVEVAPGTRFEEMIKNLYGLAQDGKTNAKGMPNLLQAALFAREFEDVLRFTKPPRPVQQSSSPSWRPSPGSWATGAVTRSTWSASHPRRSRWSPGRARPEDSPGVRYQRRTSEGVQWSDRGTLASGICPATGLLEVAAFSKSPTKPSLIARRARLPPCSCSKHLSQTPF